VQRVALDCPACGAPAPQAAAMRCGHCGATLAATRLAEAAAAVAPLEAALREQARRPSRRTVARRLAMIERNAGQQRAWAAEMEASAREGAAARWEWPDGGALPRRWLALAAILLLVVLFLFG
jgi:hypothetical protein